MPLPQFANGNSPRFTRSSRLYVVTAIGETRSGSVKWKLRSLQHMILLWQPVIELAGVCHIRIVPAYRLPGLMQEWPNHSTFSAISPWTWDWPNVLTFRLPVPWVSHVHWPSEVRQTIWLEEEVMDEVEETRVDNSPSWNQNYADHTRPPDVTFFDRNKDRISEISNNANKCVFRITNIFN